MAVVAQVAKPGAAAPAGAVVRLAFDTLSSPVGDLRIVCREEAICAIDFGDCDDRLYALLRRRFGTYEATAGRNPSGATARLERYFAGDLDVLSAAIVDGGGTPYQQRVWAALRKIAPGQTCSYGELAATVGGTHARAVGHANSQNPIAIVVPCHRVIGANATLTGYAGGLWRKRWLLDHEARYGGRCLPLDLS